MKPIRVDFEKRIIVMTKKFAAAASNPYTSEAETLRETIAAFPTFKVQKHTIKQKEGRECYKGLNYEWMRGYIATHDENAEAALAELEEMIYLSTAHSKRYPIIKRWFLNKYEEVRLYGMDAIETADRVEKLIDLEAAA